MPNDIPTNEPRNIWQNQPMEAFKMSADEIHLKAQQIQTRARIAALAWIVIGLSLCVAFAWTFAKAHELIPRIGLGLLSLWGIFGAYQAYKWIWPGTLPPNAPMATCLEFYKNELERQWHYGQHVWRKAGLTFCFFGLALIAVPQLIKALSARHFIMNAVPLFVLLALWFAIFFPARNRNQRKLQQEIEDLRMLAGEKGSGT